MLKSKNKKILCIYTVDSILCPKDKPIRYLTDIPLGISYIMAAIKHAGYDLELFVFSQKNNIKKDINKLFSENNFDIILFTSVSSQYFFVKKIAQCIKEIKPEIKNVIGGVHATLNFKDVLKEDCFDVVCVGDGEYAIIDYINHIRSNKKINNIDNLYIKISKNETLKPNKIYFVEDLDKLLPPLRDIWNKWVCFPKSYYSAYKILVTRGCYNNCSYCSNHALSKISSTKYVRYRNVEKIIEEINSVNYNKIDLVCESLTLNKQFFNDLTTALKKNNESRAKKILYYAESNVYHSILNEDFFRRIDEANIRVLGIGLESGSYKIRKKVLLRPNYSNKDLYNFCQMAKKFNIAIHTYVLIGIPYETQNDYLKTINILRKCQPNFIFVYIYMPYPGTNLYNRLIEDKIIAGYGYFNHSEERTKALVSYKNMSKLRIQLNYIFFFVRVYWKHKPLIELFILTAGRFLYCYNRFIPSFLYNFLEKKLSQNLDKLNKN